MVTGLDSITTQLTTAALDALLLRHRVIASNIANQGVEGYQPLRVDFEKHLEPVRQALAAGRTDEQLRGLLQEAKAATEITPAPGDGIVRLDEEMAELARNTLHYQALLTALGKLGALKRLAITGSQS